GRRWARIRLYILTENSFSIAESIHGLAIGQLHALDEVLGGMRGRDLASGIVALGKVCEGGIDKSLFAERFLEIFHQEVNVVKFQGMHGMHGGLQIGQTRGDMSDRISNNSMRNLTVLPPCFRMISLHDINPLSLFTAVSGSPFIRCCLATNHNPPPGLCRAYFRKQIAREYYFNLEICSCELAKEAIRRHKNKGLISQD